MSPVPLRCKGLAVRLDERSDRAWKANMRDRSRPSRQTHGWSVAVLLSLRKSSSGYCRIMMNISNRP